jgi:replication-associated recombination protein RarA
MALRDLLRPKTISDLIGQESAKKIVRRIIESKAKENLLFLGESGTGKTTLALIAAREITGQQDEGIAGWGGWIHLNSSQSGNKDFISGTVSELARYGGLKIFIFDEAHTITRDSQTLLLNLLERSGNTLYFFCTTQPKKLSYELRTRCQKVKFEWLTHEECVGLIQSACGKLDVRPPPGFIEEIHRRGLGNPRAILNALESAINGMPIAEAVDLEMPDGSSVPRRETRSKRERQRERISKLLRRKDSPSVRRIASEVGCSPETVQRQKERLGLKMAPRRRLSF